MYSGFDLGRIGANDRVLRAFRPFVERGWELARVSIVQREQYRLYTASGEVTAQAAGALLYHLEDPAHWPAVGDWVAVQRVDDSQAVVQAVLPRATVFSRRAPGAAEEQQVMAANVDVALIVCSLDHDFSLRRIERYLTLVRDSGSEPVIILNKIDLCQNVAALMQQVRSIAGAARILAISAPAPDCVDSILEIAAAHRTLALVGSSGVGKSTLVNTLLGASKQSVQPVRETDSKGRHTTTHRELLPLPGGGAIIDTPGMRELQLWASEASLDEAFDEIAQLAEHCRYHDCTHTVDEGCAVRDAIDPARYQSFLKLRSEIAFHERKTDVRAALALKQRWKAIHKASRGSKPRAPGA
jgi:ribosome biogenesis GTPase